VTKPVRLLALSRVNPLARVGHAEVVALLESHWTTGTVIPCDGGATGVFQ
jgi:hypothetical protein